MSKLLFAVAAAVATMAMPSAAGQIAKTSDANNSKGSFVTAGVRLMGMTFGSGAKPAGAGPAAVLISFSAVLACRPRRPLVVAA